MLNDSVLPLPAGNAVLADAVERGDRFAGRGGGGAIDGAGLVARIEPFPAFAAKPFEGTVADLVLHPGGAFDPIAEIDVGQPRSRGAQDVIENDEIAKPGTRLMLWISRPTGSA